MELEDAVNNNYVPGNPPSGQSTCAGHEHFVIQLIDEVYHISVNDVFNYIFSDSSLFQEFVHLRNTYDVSLGSWSDEPDGNGIKTRFISYTLSINYSIGPKCSPSSETQRLLPESQPGVCYLIDAECYNGGVPYADDFFTLVRYCIMKTGENKCRLHISGKVIYKKHIWGLIKTLIDKTANTGLATSFGVMASLLRRESERRKMKLDNRRLGNSSHGLDEQKALSPSQRIFPLSNSHVKERILHHPPRKRHVGTSNATNCNGLHGTKRKLNVYHYKEDALNSSAMDFLARLIFVVVIFLVIVNLALFYQITLLETTVASAITKYSIH